VGGKGAFSLARRPEKRRRRRNPYYPSPQISQISPPPQVEGKGEIAWVVAVVWGLTLVGKLGEWRDSTNAKVSTDRHFYTKTHYFSKDSIFSTGASSICENFTSQRDLLRALFHVFRSCFQYTLRMVCRLEGNVNQKS
jgi:hypothetical protein